MYATRSALQVDYWVLAWIEIEQRSGRVRSFMLEPRTLVDDSGREEDVDDGALSRHVRGIKQQLEVCSTASDLPSPGRSTSTLCVSSMALVYLLTCDLGLAWLCQPAIARLTAGKYDAATLDTTRHNTTEAEV